ncbi:MAG: hypothetical protein JNG86_20780 [Verrucomicrobiaceae bacterium]|nr:hypothetical protein [Verrucomicrobiaceae bacterium]
MKTPTRTFLAALAAALLTALPASAADKVEQWINLMPKDTVGILAFKSMPELLADWDKSAFGKFMQDEEAKRWLEPMKEDGQMPWDKHFKDIYGTGLYETLKDERGAAVGFFVLGDPKEMDPKDGPPFIGLSEITDNQSLQEEHKRRHREHLKKDKHPNLKESTIDISGVTVSIAADSDEPDAKWVDAYAFVDGVMVEAKNRKLMEYIIGAVKSGSGDAPAEIREHFGRLAQLREGTADVTIYMNGTRILDLVKQSLADAEKNKAGEKKAAAPNPMGDIKPEQIMEVIGLHEMKGLAITMDFADERSTSDVVIFHPEKPAGILSWVTTDAKDVELPAFIAADVASGQVSRVDWLKLYDGLMGMITKLSPQMGMMANMYLGGFEQQNGFKIRDDFFASLADENFQVQDSDGKKQSDVMGFKIKNAEKLGTALKGIQNALGGMGFAAFDESDYLGYKINTLKMSTANAGTPAGAMPEIAYVNTGKHLLIGSGTLDALRKTLGRMKDPSGGSLWETPRAQAQMALVPKGFSGLGIADSSKMISMVFNAMEMVSKQAGTQKKAAATKKGPGKGPAKGGDAAKPADAAGDALAKLVDSKNRPSDATFQKYFGTMMSASYSHPDAMHVQMLSTPVEAK